MPRVKVNGWRFLYRQAGSGPDVVLLPGAANAPAGRLLFDVLGEDFRATVYEPRGGAPGASNSADIADDLRGLQEKLGLGPTYLVAHRDSALAALHTAVLYPEMVAGMVLTEPCLPEARNSAARPVRSALTTRRILLIEQPVVALCGPSSPALPMCRFLADNLPWCKAVPLPEDESRLAARIHDHLRDMAGRMPARSSKSGPRGPLSRLWPETGDGRAIARWMSRLSAWGL